MSWRSLPVWWRGRLPRYRLTGALCERCGRVHYPPRESCPYCGSHELRSIELPRIGTLLSYTIIRSPPGDNRLSAPVMLGLVELEVEAGGKAQKVRVIAELTDVTPEELREGKVELVEAVVRKVDEQGETGVIGYAIKFRPALETGGR